MPSVVHSLVLSVLVSVAAGQVGPSRDELVLNAVLTHFLADKDPYFSKAGGSKAVVLVPRNPAKTGILDQTEYDIGKRKLGTDLLGALRSRNRGSGWNSKPISYAHFRLDPRVVIKDLPKSDGRLFGDQRYFEAFAPGYSKDGRRAVVRAWVGPTAHGATATYALELKDGRWKVLWREFAIYA